LPARQSPARTGDHYGSFAKTGNPNVPACRRDVSITAPDRQIMEFGAITTARLLLPTVMFEAFRRLWCREAGSAY